MLHEMATGRPPFLGDDAVAVIGQHMNTPPVAPTWHNPLCPRPLDALILRLLSKDPSERPEAASDVLSALEAVDLFRRSPSVARYRRPGCRGPWGTLVTPWTTRWPRASSPPCRPSSSTAGPGQHASNFDQRSSITSRGSTTGTGAIPRWAT